MIEKLLTHTQVYYTDTPRHWCPVSEKYTGADSLISALRNGWSLSRLVYREDFLHGGARHSAVYFFELKQGQRIVTMPIVSTPFIVRFIAVQNLKVVHATGVNNTLATAEEPVVKLA